MSADRRAALVAGVLYVLGMIAGVLSVAPSVDGQNYLIEAAANETQVMRAAVLPVERPHGRAGARARGVVGRQRVQPVDAVCRIAMTEVARTFSHRVHAIG